jgi:hypothetical protein
MRIKSQLSLSFGLVDDAVVVAAACVVGVEVVGGAVVATVVGAAVVSGGFVVFCAPAPAVMHANARSVARMNETRRTRDIGATVIAQTCAGTPS